MAEEKECQWQLLRSKNKLVLGTWEEEGVFQVSLRNQGSPEDPIHLPLFSDFLPYHCIPHIGVYSPDDYAISLPQAIITLPTSGLSTLMGLFTVLPPELQQTIRGYPSVPASQIEAAIIIHSQPQLEISQQPEAREINLMLHTWAFRGMTTTTSSETSGEDEAHITVEVGVFGGEAVRETAQDICEELNGVSVGRMGQRILYMHDTSFSPHNCQLALQPESPLHSFFSLARHPTAGMVLAYHILTSSEVAESRMKRALCDSQTVADLLRHLHLLVTDFPTMQPILTTLCSLITTE